MGLCGLDKRVTLWQNCSEGEAPVKIPIQLITIQRARRLPGGHEALAEAAVGKPYSQLYHWLRLFSFLSKQGQERGTRVLIVRKINSG